MPTGAKLISAAFYGFLTYIAAHIVHHTFEVEIGYEQDFGLFKEITAVIGGLVGWKVQGPRVGEGYYLAIQGGFITSVAIVFWGLVLWALVEMINESMKMKYKGAMHAIKDSFMIAIEYAKTIAVPEFIITMAVGALIGGILAEYTSSRFR